MYLKCYAGDNAEFAINTLNAISWSDRTNWSFIFTAKESLSDLDSAAKIQRTHTNGITLVEGSLPINNGVSEPSGTLGAFLLKLVRLDTVGLLGKTLYCDIQGYKAAAGGVPAKVTRFAYFRLRVDPAVTRQITPSITINS